MRDHGPGPRPTVAAGLILGAAVVSILVPVLTGSTRASEAFLACDRTGGDWDRAAQVCREPDTPLSGAPM